MSEPLTDDDTALLRFIRGEGEHAIYGKGISTYPDRDAGNQIIYAACVRLEQRGFGISAYKRAGACAVYAERVI